MDDALIILLIDAGIFAAYFLGFVLMCALRGLSAFGQYGGVFGQKEAVRFTLGAAAAALLWTARTLGWLPSALAEHLPIRALAAVPLLFSVRLFVLAWRRCPLRLRAGLLIAMITNGLVALARFPGRLLARVRRGKTQAASAPSAKAKESVH